MKTNAPKRKVFTDAVDLLTGDMPVAAAGGVQNIAIEKIQTYKNHPFRLYEGERLAEMVESIKEHGILSPVIVRTAEGGFEMLAGHNRMNAARLAGLTEIPAIVKENLSDDDAIIYVIETNLIQRGFNELSISEKAAVLDEAYNKVISQGRRNDIIRELEQLSGKDATCGHDVHKLDRSRESIGREYGLTGRHIARYIRCNQLVPELKEMLDDGSLTMVSAVELSYLPEDEQKTVKKVMDQNCIKLKTDKAGELRGAAGNLSEDAIQKMLGVDKPVKQDTPKPVSVKLPASVYQRYFSNTAAKDVQGILEAALELYFKKGA